MNSSINKKVGVVFVGGFAKDINKIEGGQVFACTTLVNSALKESVDWTLVDTTANMQLERSFFSRLKAACSRIFTFTKAINKKDRQIALVFTSFGFSLVEKGIMVAIAKTAGKKTILCPRSGIIMKEAEKKPRTKNWLKTILGKTDVLLCQSEFWKSYYQSVLPSKKASDFRVRYNWIDVETYVNNNPEPDYTRKQEVSILFIGRIDDNKGIFDIIEAARILHARKLRFQFRIGGTGPKKDEALALIKEYGLANHFEFLGFVDKPRKLEELRQSDIYILTSYFEGYPNALIEGMASGVACVSTQVGSVNDIIEHERNGLSFLPGDYETFANHLERLIVDESLREQMGQAARKDTLSLNALDHAVRDFEQLFKELATPNA